MLPRIYDDIGHMKLTDIRPYHLNDLYKHLAENGIRNKGAIATAKKVVKKKVAALKLPKCAIVKEAGFSQTTLNAILRGDSVTYANAEKLATYLGYSVSELFVVEDKFKPLSDKTILEHHRLISNGIDPVTTANELGHANANTTQAIYAHQIARARAEASGVRAGVFSVLREA